MTGWKSKVAGIGAILSGAGLVVGGVAGNQFDFDTVKQGIAAILSGFGILGIAHKIEKAGAAK